MVKHILFDLDDTLYTNTAGLMQEISLRMNEFLIAQVGVPAADVNRIRRDYWERYGTTLRGLYIERHIDAQAFLNFVHDIRVDRYLQADPTLDAMLAQVTEQKYIFTNSPVDHARRVLGALGVAKYFSTIFDINFIEYQSKPTPSAYDKVLDALGARGDDCLMIDDSARNLAPAKALGMRTVLVDLKNEHVPDGHVDRVITTIYQFADILKEWK